MALFFKVFEQRMIQVQTEKMEMLTQYQESKKKRQ